MGIKKYLSRQRKSIDKVMLSYVPRGNRYTRTLYDAVKYSLMSGGKRIRPILVLAACEAVSDGFEKALPAAAAIEMIHTYTLIHDDLPAMDNDNFRRGKPTCHRVFGEDAAILAGDMLNALAFQIIAENYRETANILISELSGALGIGGVAGGQLADLKSKSGKVDLSDLEFISMRKTACLFIASVRMGAIIGGASKSVLSKLTKYAEHLGLAFQITDDILDYAGGEKTGYPALLGIEESKRKARKTLDLALNALPREKNYGVLREIAVFLGNRKE